MGSEIIFHSGDGCDPIPTAELYSQLIDETARRWAGGPELSLDFRRKEREP